MRLVVATTNRGKAAEFRRMLNPPQSSVLSPRASLAITALTDYPALPVVEETGSTFLANACLKAGSYARGLNEWTLADDSGLSVDALDGKPGVHSARWAEMHGGQRGDAANNALLLRQMEHVPDGNRAARFVCALALSDPQGRIILTASDWVSGRILRRPAGEGGFGYDPLFFLDSHGKTTAELPPDEKDALSHRGRAARRMLELINRHAADLPL
jgi:non-canonical purine NTP pyrophosphatase (RdgB/HAM1 family)